MVPEMSIFNQPTWLIAWEDFINVSHLETSDHIFMKILQEIVQLCTNQNGLDPIKNTNSICRNLTTLNQINITRKESSRIQTTLSILMVEIQT
jgi:hypothetical protein